MTPNMKTKFKLILIALFTITSLWSCFEDTEYPASVEIPVSSSGLIGNWELVRIEVTFPIELLDSLGQVVTDEKNQNVWVDSVSILTPEDSLFTEEFISLRSENGIDTFTIYESLEQLNTDSLIAHAFDATELPIGGHWGVIETTNPDNGEMVQSLILYHNNPNQIHKTGNSRAITIMELNNVSCIMEYSTISDQLYDRIWTLTYNKLE